MLLACFEWMAVSPDAADLGKWGPILTEGLRLFWRLAELKSKFIAGLFGKTIWIAEYLVQKGAESCLGRRLTEGKEKAAMMNMMISLMLRTSSPEELDQALNYACPLGTPFVERLGNKGFEQAVLPQVSEQSLSSLHMSAVEATNLNGWSS